MNYDPSTYPQGVPNPWVPNVQEYPSPQHGGDWTRPMFGLPWVQRPYNVPGPPENKYALGQLPAKERSAWLYAFTGALAVTALTRFGGELGYTSITKSSVGREERDVLDFASVLAGAAAFFAVGLAVAVARKEAT